MPSRRSGGARQVAAKHLERDAKRPEGYRERQRAAYQRAVRGKRGLDRVAAAAQWALDSAAVDPGPPPEHCREQVIRAALALAKVIDPARVIADLDARLRKALGVIESLEAKLRAARQSQGATGATGAPEHH